MRNALLVGASAVALVLGGCSMLDSGKSAPAQPAYSGSSQTPSQSSSQTTPTGQMGSTQMGSTMSPAMSGHAAMTHHTTSSANPEQVKQAQQKLKDDGDYMGQVDGKYGPQTAQAVKQYQKKNGLHQTGRLDHATVGKLGVSTTSSGSSVPPAASATPSSGSSAPPAASMSPPSGSMTPPSAAITPPASASGKPDTTAK